MFKCPCIYGSISRNSVLSHWSLCLYLCLFQLYTNYRISLFFQQRLIDTWGKTILSWAGLSCSLRVLYYPWFNHWHQMPGENHIHCLQPVLQPEMPWSFPKIHWEGSPTCCWNPQSSFLMGLEPLPLSLILPFMISFHSALLPGMEPTTGCPVRHLWSWDSLQPRQPTPLGGRGAPVVRNYCLTMTHFLPGSWNPPKQKSPLLSPFFIDLQELAEIPLPSQQLSPDSNSPTSVLSNILQGLGFTMRLWDWIGHTGLEFLLSYL